MNIQKATQMLEAICSNEKRSIVVFLQGPPGIGKTNICEQIANRLNKKLVNFALPSCEAVDLRGLPQIINGRTHWACPLPKEGSGILVLDEIASAPADVQVAAHHVVWSQEGSEIGAGNGWHIILTGNRSQDKTYYRALGAPLRNRIAMIEVEADPGVWVAWAMEQGINPLITGFIRWRPELLTPKNGDIPNEGAFPSPRAWDQASRVLHLSGISADIESEMLRGLVGQGAHTELMAYLRTARELPSIEAIEANQEKAEVPSSPSLLYALITSLSQYTRQTKKSLAKFASRCPAEFALLYIRDIAGHYPLKSDPDIRAWVAGHKKLFSLDTLS